MKVRYALTYALIIGHILLSCNSTTPIKELENTVQVNTIDTNVISRKRIENRPSEIDKQKPKVQVQQTSVQNEIENISPKGILIIHAFVPLCDNENQGIVPVNETLGDGLNLKTNLYWGALYGVKTHIKRQASWKYLNSSYNVNADILERAIFSKRINGKTLYLIADAYRGDRMKECLKDYFAAASGNKTDSLTILDSNLGIAGSSDLIIFNGHNGLMDCDVNHSINNDGRKRDVAAIGCISFPYFKAFFKSANATPVLTTTNLLAPEAYVMDALITSWAKDQKGETIRTSVAQAYNKYQKCGLRGAKALFKSGW